MTTADMWNAAEWTGAAIVALLGLIVALSLLTILCAGLYAVATTITDRRK